MALRFTILAMLLVSLNAICGQPTESPKPSEKPAVETPKPPDKPAAETPTPDKPKADKPAPEAYELITDKEIAKIEFDDLPPDTDIVTPFAPNLDHLEGDQRKEFDAWV